MSSLKKTTRKSQRTKASHLGLLGVCLLLIILVGAGGASLVYYHHKHTSSVKTADTGKPINTIDYSAAPAADNQPNENRKGSSAPSSTLDSGGSSSATSSSTPAPFSVQMVSHTVSNGNLHIGTLVNGTTSGTCTLTASQSGKGLTLGSNAVQLDVGSYDCKVFNVATSEFPSTGIWTLKLTLSSNGSTASSSANVTI